MLTTTNTNTTTTTTTNTIITNTQNNNTAQMQQQMQQQQMRLRDRWEERVTDALFRQLKRKVRAANALFGTPEWVSVTPDATWFMLHHEEDVTRHATLAEECLDDARAHAKRKGRALPPLEYLPRGILESEALEPYLKRWKRDDAAAAAAAAAAPTRARCAYPLMD
jgi:hypothetical protein